MGLLLKIRPSNNLQSTRGGGLDIPFCFNVYVSLNLNWCDLFVSIVFQKCFPIVYVSFKADGSTLMSKKGLADAS